MLWRIFKRLDLKQLFGLFWMFLKNPQYAIPTVLATKECMDIAAREFGSRHHLSNPANAFRHALWVILIIKKCCSWKLDDEKAIAWAERFTNWHEKFSPNGALEHAMDLHNNQMGIVFYEEIKYKTVADSISFLKVKAAEAKQIITVKETINFQKTLVFIND